MLPASDASLEQDELLIHIKGIDPNGPGLCSPGRLTTAVPSGSVPSSFKSRFRHGDFDDAELDGMGVSPKWRRLCLRWATRQGATAGESQHSRFRVGDHTTGLL